MSSGAPVVASGPNSTLSMIQSMVRSWQKKSQDQIDKDVASLKANASSLESASIFIGQASSGKLVAAIIQAGLQKGGTSDPNQEWAEAYTQEQEAEFVRENSMSSQEISNDLYSGTGIANEFTRSRGTTDSTFKFWTLYGWLLNKDNPNTNLADQINQAIGSHILQIQKATDFAGLDYHLSVAFDAANNGSSIGYEESWNHAAAGVTVTNTNWVSNVAADGKHHLLINPTGDLGIYFSW